MSDSYSRAIKNFGDQFSYQPEIKNQEKLERKERIVIVGMGGSRLAGDILRMWKPDKEIIVHSDYALPSISSEHLKGSLVIANSHSGNTEETIDAALKAIEQGLALAVVAGGGKLIDIAKTNNLPYIQVPADRLPARTDTGHDLMALLKIMGDEDAFNEAALLQSINPETFETEGKDLAEILDKKIPLFYTSERNMELGYMWKVIVNETAKFPAFCNRFPELNHNEISGFDSSELPRNFFHFVFLHDSDDDRTGNIGLRMSKLEELYNKRDLGVTKIELKGDSHLKKIYSSILLAHWTAYYLAKQYEVDPEETKFIEEFKKAL